MSNYVKSTNFAVKDALTTGDVNKRVKGTEIDTEFNEIATAVNSKANSASPALSGTPTAPTAAYGTDTTQIATTAFVQDALALLYPVGSVYFNATDNTNPGTLFGFGTWVAWGAGRMPVGFDSGNTLFDAAEETGGSADAVNVSHTHTASVTDTGHTHNVPGALSYTSGSTWRTDAGGLALTTTNLTASSNTTGITVGISTDGSSATNANIPPYITVYMWKRTA